MWKIVKNFFLLFILIAINSGIAFSDYIDKDEVLKIDNEDHEKCVNKVSINSDDSLELYWNCRTNLINDRISESKKRYNFFKDNYGKELQNIKKVILYRREEALDKIYQKKYNKRYIQTVFLEDSDWYYFDLINEKFTTEVVYVQQLREVKEKKQKIAKENKEEQKRREAFCYKYKDNNKMFSKCLESIRLSKVCLDTLEESVLERELQYKFDCMKSSIEKYPDSLVLYNNEYEKLVNLKKDKYVIDRQNDKKIDNRKKELDKMISGPKLSKEQLINLRKEEENNCFMNKTSDIDIFRNILVEQCEKIRDIK